MNVMLDFDNASSGTSAVPSEEDFTLWLQRTLEHVQEPDENKPVRIGIRVVDEDESAELNHHYRHKEKPTNVLSFGADLPPDVLAALDEIPLGDLAICASVVASEAIEQGKPVADHWAHMSIHGTLHLLGFDHEDEAQAEEMEALEREILASLGIPDPYLGERAS